MSSDPKAALEPQYGLVRAIQAGVEYLLEAHMGALETQAETWKTQAQQIRWGGAQLPMGVSRDSAADQLTAAAEKVGAEVDKIRALLADLGVLEDEEKH